MQPIDPTSLPKAPENTTVPTVTITTPAAIVGQRSLNEKTETFYDINELKGLNLKHLRTSDLPLVYHFAWLVPVIGWIWLACHKINHIVAHNRAEKLMKGVDDANTDQEKITQLSNVITAAGPVKWQYQMERARLHLLNNHFTQAAQDLGQVHNDRGSPEQMARTSDNLVSMRNGAWFYLEYRDGEEALLNAIANAARGNDVEAYDAYNEVIYDNSKLSSVRNHQIAIFKKMLLDFSKVPLSIRAQRILLDESEALLGPKN